MDETNNTAVTDVPDFKPWSKERIEDAAISRAIYAGLTERLKKYFPWTWKLGVEQGKTIMRMLTDFNAETGRDIAEEMKEEHLFDSSWIADDLKILVNMYRENEPDKCAHLFAQFICDQWRENRMSNH